MVVSEMNYAFDFQYKLNEWRLMKIHSNLKKKKKKKKKKKF